MASTNKSNSLFVDGGFAQAAECNACSQSSSALTSGVGDMRPLVAGGSTRHRTQGCHHEDEKRRPEELSNICCSAGGCLPLGAARLLVVGSMVCEVDVQRWQHSLSRTKHMLYVSTRTSCFSRTNALSLERTPAPPAPDTLSLCARIFRHKGGELAFCIGRYNTEGNGEITVVVTNTRL